MFSSEVEGDVITLRAYGLRKGLGQTYGNFIRRLVMLELGSYKVIGVKINGGSVRTYFTMIENVVEDVLDIVYNLHEIEFEPKHNNVKDILRYSLTEQEGHLTAGLAETEDLAVKNKDSTICNTVKGTGITLDLIVGFNKGNVSSPDNKMRIEEEYGVEDGMIYLDTFHKGYDKVYFTVNELDGQENLEVKIEGITPTSVEEIKRLFNKTGQELSKIL